MKLSIAVVLLVMIFTPAAQAQTASAPRPATDSEIDELMESQQQPSEALTDEARQHYQDALGALQNNDYDKALSEMNVAANLAPDNGLIWYYVALIEEKQGNASKAKEHLQKAVALGLPLSAREDAAQLSERLSHKGAGDWLWLVGSWTGKFNNEFQEQVGPYDCNYKGETTFYLFVSDYPDRLSGVFEVSGKSYHQGILNPCPIVKSGKAHFDITTGGISGGIPFVEGELKSCEGDIVLGQVSVCSKYAVFTDHVPLLSGALWPVDRFGFKLADLTLQRRDADHLDAQLVSGELVTLEKGKVVDESASGKASRDEIYGDASLTEAISLQGGINAHLLDNDPESKQDQVQTIHQKWAYAKEMWHDALQWATDQQQVSRLNAKLAGGGITCSEDSKCVANDSDQFCGPYDGQICMPKFAF